MPVIRTELTVMSRLAVVQPPAMARSVANIILRYATNSASLGITRLLKASLWMQLDFGQCTPKTLGVVIEEG